MIEQIVWTRLDTLLGTAGIVRRAVAEATWHARHRSALGAPLAQQPAMRNVLADLALESEAMLAAAMRIVRGAAGPAVPRRAARHRLGGLGQRHRPRRTARDAPQPRRGAGADGRARGRDRRRPALRRAPERGQVFLGHTGSWCGKERLDPLRVGRAGVRGGPRRGPAGRGPAAQRAARRRRRVLRRPPWTPTATAPSGPSRAASTPRRSSPRRSRSRRPRPRP
ncbi:MAG TPA: acyl-CoA dehydrogenase family protein [Solirubrobacteraceae bacterium]|nr:acyl-CoA dehydrogenase family protein [Solirubrobacteraceae bacterium]